MPINVMKTKQLPLENYPSIHTQFQLQKHKHIAQK